MGAGKIESDQIKLATAGLEQGHADVLRTVLHGHSQEERIEALHCVQNQYQKDKAANPNLPDLEVQTNAWIPANSNETVSVGGRTLFASSLELGSLTRQDYVDGKAVGGRERTVGDEPKVDPRALADKLEAGDGRGARQLMANTSEEERIQALQAVRELNRNDLLGGRTRASLSIEIEGTKQAQAVISIDRSLGASDAFFGGANIYNERFSPRTGQFVIQDHQDER